MEREKLAERIEFLTGCKYIDEETKDNDPTGKLLETFCNRWN